MWPFLDLFANGARTLDNFRPLFDHNSDHPRLLDSVKQLGFYTDCLGNAHWSVPADIVDDKLAATLVHTAEILAGKREIAPREIELWIKHLQPVWKTTLPWMKGALKNWYSEMQAEGLAPPGPNAMETFIDRGITPPDPAKDPPPPGA